MGKNKNDLQLFFKKSVQTLYTITQLCYYCIVVAHYNTINLEQRNN